MSDEETIAKAVCFAREFLASNIFHDDLMSAPPSLDTLTEMEEALKRAATNPDTNDFDTLTALIIDRREKGQSLPEWLADFATKVAIGEIKRPTKRGRSQFANFIRDYEIWRCVEEISRRFPLARYDSTGLSESPTAASIVADIRNLSVESVIAICKKRNRLGEK
jgi:hypothetical protein